MSKPSKTTYPAHFEKYVNQVPESDLPAALHNQYTVFIPFLNSIGEQKSTFAYAPEKWTIKEVLQHIIDAERIFNYRALCIARGETGSLPGFDENAYAANTNTGQRTWQSLVNEFIAVRKSTELLYESFTDEMLQRSGISNNKPATALSFGFITVGHVYHHKKVIEERYLV